MLLNDFFVCCNVYNEKITEWGNLNCLVIYGNLFHRRGKREFTYRAGKWTKGKINIAREVNPAIR